jgi:hypothetical protein
MGKATTNPAPEQKNNKRKKKIEKKKIKKTV